MGAAIFIAGPTASGKSAVAYEIAQRLNGEIISVDSMQVYRGLDLGTAKPTVEERARVLHHNIDILELTESFDAAKFVARTKTIIKKIKQPIFCGGTGLYFSAWLEGLGEAPQANATLRAELEEEELIIMVMEYLLENHGFGLTFLIFLAHIYLRKTFSKQMTQITLLKVVGVKIFLV